MTNRTAFLDMLAKSEGTYFQGTHGYNVLVGSTLAHPSLFQSYADHPRILVNLGHGLKSTAAGRYQLLERYYDAYKAQLKLPDFSPASQDAIALQQIRECRALPLIDAGNIVQAIQLCAHIWASLPGAGYGQPENRLATLLDDYAAGGGQVIDTDTEET